MNKSIVISLYINKITIILHMLTTLVLKHLFILVKVNFYVYLHLLTLLAL